MSELSRADVEHVAYLARLGLSTEELTRLEGQLNHILEQYQVLVQLDTEAIPPSAQTIELENILRDDAARPSLGQEEALSGAPEREGEYFRVPIVVEGGEAAGSGESPANGEGASGGESSAGGEAAGSGESPAGGEAAGSGENAAGREAAESGESPPNGDGAAAGEGLGIGGAATGRDGPRDGKA